VPGLYEEVESKKGTTHHTVTLRDEERFAMRRLVIVSNRLPVSVERRGGKLQFQPSAGGLATGLGSFYKSYDSLWIGWPGIATNRKNGEQRDDIKTRLLSEFSCAPVFLPQRDIEEYYEGFCNKTIWPLYHYFTEFVVYDGSFYECYERVNRRFCDAIVDVAKQDDMIWIHDYHLMLLPRMVREQMPDATIGFFLHIPFPSFEVFRLLPWRRQILEGLLGADLVGFHTYDYARHFLSTVRNLCGYEQSVGHISTGERTVRVDVFPMGIDYQRYAEAVESPEAQGTIEKLRKKCGDCKVILSIDRLDYTKGIPQRLEAFDELLQRNPQYKEKVTLILVAVPSRTKVEHYRLLKKRVDELIGKINGEHGTIGWVPIWYLYRFLRYPVLNSLYNLADVAVVTPSRDGMNLIAKEYVASKHDGKGVLILSEMAGASNELGEAITVNPNNKEEMVRALETALQMPEEEQIERISDMQKRLQRYDVGRWAEDFVDRMLYIKNVQREMHARMLTPAIKHKLVDDYRRSERRLLLLDYDGTLIPLFLRPDEAQPTEHLLQVLARLSEDPRNETAIISGRDKDTLQTWFGELDLGLVAEHGAWIKEKEWELIEPLTDEWKKEIRPILELYVDRTPRSFIEEKEFSLVWHYRKAESELASERARELKETLLGLTSNLEIGVLEGSKVMEVKNRGINKGRAALLWISREPWDFVLAIGDDLTDEDVFTLLPESAYSVRVGLLPTKAHFNIASQYEVTELLEELIKAGAAQA